MGRNSRISAVVSPLYAGVAGRTHHRKSANALHSVESSTRCLRHLSPSDCPRRQETDRRRMPIAELDNPAMVTDATFTKAHEVLEWARSVSR